MGDQREIKGHSARTHRKHFQQSCWQNKKQTQRLQDVHHPSRRYHKNFSIKFQHHHYYFYNNYYYYYISSDQELVAKHFASLPAFAQYAASLFCCPICFVQKKGKEQVLQ